MHYILELKDVAKRYRRGRQHVEVLHKVDLQVMQGEFIALMGPSGSGKTTLLNLIGGLDCPDEGQITVAGKRVDLLSQQDLTKWRATHIGFIFQFYNLLPSLSAKRNVELPLLLTELSTSDRKARVAAALQLVGLSDRANHTPRELSGGQQQRVAIARSLVADPTILVCDEPTGDLDRQTATDILELLQLLSVQKGKTIIMVTHDPRAADFATRQLQMDKGHLVTGTLSEAA